MSEFRCHFGCEGPHTRVADRDAKSGQPLEVRICLDCGLVQQLGIPSPERLREYYSHRYREDYKGIVTPKAKHIWRAANAGRERLQFIKAALALTAEESQPKTLLDIGAGGGEVVCVARSFGFLAEGIEPNHGYSEFARQAYDVRVDTLHLDQALDRRADLVTLFHVLEHLPDPSAAMRAMFQLVNPGGYLMIEVPNIEQSDASPANIYFKAHLYYFGRASLVALASPYFEPIKIEHRGNLRGLFRRRHEAGPRVLPSQQEVAATLLRLSQKGWAEYLSKGGGWKKPFSRLIQYRREFQVKNLTPAQIVERAVAAQRRL